MVAEFRQETIPNTAVQDDRYNAAVQYIRAKVNQLLTLMGTLPLRPEELDDATLIELDPIGIIAGSFEQVLAHLNQTNHELAIARNEIRAVFDSLGAAVVVVNKESIVDDCNAQALEWFFHADDASQIIGRPLADVCPCNEHLLATQQAGSRQVSEFTYENRHYQLVTSAILNEDNQIEKVVHLYFDITPQKRAEEILTTQATTDALTGIANRRQFNAILGTEMRRAERYHMALSLILLDIDNFKQINDTLGHQVGDKVLVELARLLSGMIREQDVFARWGGEEFAILASSYDAEGIEKFAEKLRHAVETHSFPGVGRVTCSFGLAARRRRESVESLFRRVDAALYRAKENGRNRVESA
jgi:diguanylate cyclase (GGDEF)-like protein